MTIKEMNTMLNPKHSYKEAVKKMYNINFTNPRQNINVYLFHAFELTRIGL